jgi:protein TonB
MTIKGGALVLNLWQVQAAILSGALLTLACAAVNPSPGRPGIDYEIPPESPPYSGAPLPSDASVDPGTPDPTAAPPKLVKQTRPNYPRWAFDRKIQGTVTLEIVIEASGRVAAWKILRSIPSLDAAAIKCVRQWSFSPARKNGQVVATVAQAPVSFRIY